MTTEEKLKIAIQFIEHIKNIKSSNNTKFNINNYICKSYYDDEYDDTEYYISSNFLDDLSDSAWHVLADIS